MPRKKSPVSMEAMLMAHFMTAPLMVAEAQLAMLTEMVRQKRGQQLEPLPGKGRPMATVVTPIKAAGVVPGQPPVQTGQAATPAKSHKKKPVPGAAPGVGPASTAPGGPAAPSQPAPGDPGMPTGHIG